MGRKEKGSQAQETVWLKVWGKEKPGAFLAPQTVSVRGGERWAWKDGLHRGCLVHHAEEFWLYKQQIVVAFLKKCLKFFDFRFLFGKVNTLHMKQNSKDKMMYNQIYVLPALIPQGSSQRSLPRGRHFYHFLSILSEKLHIYKQMPAMYFFFINGILVIYCCRENYSPAQWLTHFLSLFLWVTGIWEQLRWGSSGSRYLMKLYPRPQWGPGSAEAWFGLEETSEWVIWEREIRRCIAHPPLLVTTLLGYKSCATKLTHVKYTIQWFFSIFTELCNHYHNWF